MGDLYTPGMVRGFLLPLKTVDTDRGSRLAPIFFQTMPAISGDTKSANYSGGDQPLGRAEPFQIYAGSGARAFSIECAYVAVSDRYEHRWVMHQISRLQALCYPIYSRTKITDRGTMQPPPMCLFNLGDRYVNLPILINSVSVNYPAEDAYHPVSMLPIIARVSIQVTVSYPYGQVPGHDDIAKKFLGGADTHNAGSGDSILPDMTSQDYSEWVENMPNLRAPSDLEASAAAELTSRTFFSNRRQSYVVSRSPADVSFSDQDTGGEEGASSDDFAFPPSDETLGIPPDSGGQGISDEEFQEILMSEAEPGTQEELDALYNRLSPEQKHTIDNMAVFYEG